MRSCPDPISKHNRSYRKLKLPNYGGMHEIQVAHTRAGGSRCSWISEPPALRLSTAFVNEKKREKATKKDAHEKKIEAFEKKGMCTSVKTWNQENFPLATTKEFK